tara:strand:- start:510 stop:1241 length:732 start_codon:yes stop_codon:yes gene_type:complete
MKMKNKYLDAFTNHVFFRWFLNTKSDKKINYFTDIGSDFEQTALWSIFATCHSVQLQKHAFTEEFNVIGHGETPDNISAANGEIQFVVSYNGLNKYDSKEVEEIFKEVNRIMQKNGNFLFSFYVGNPEFHLKHDGFYDADEVYRLLAKYNFEVVNDLVVYPWPYFLNKETIYPNTANEQVIDVYREQKSFQEITDDDGNSYTFLVPTTNLLTSLGSEDFASLVILARKDSDFTEPANDDEEEE